MLKYYFLAMRPTAVRRMSSHVKGPMKDVKNIQARLLASNEEHDTIYSTFPSERTDDPGFWEKTTNGISGALDATETFVEIEIKKPVIGG